MIDKQEPKIQNAPPSDGGEEFSAAPKPRKNGMMTRLMSFILVVAVAAGIGWAVLTDKHTVIIDAMTASAKTETPKSAVVEAPEPLAERPLEH